MAPSFYEDLAPIYDSMIRWEKRLATETQLFERIWASNPTRSVLDAACGSGRHLALFARQGIERLAGADASEAMLRLASEQIQSLPDARRPPLINSTWAELPERIPGTFDAVLCLGNSLPYVTDLDELAASLRGLWSRVAPGGFLLIQFKNFARLRARGERFLPLSARTEPDGRETVCVRQYDWRESTVDFQVIFLRRGPGIEGVEGGWEMRHWVTPLATYAAEDIVPVLERAGVRCAVHGSLALEPFRPGESEDIVIEARRA